MPILDDLKRVKRLDPDNALGSIGLLGDQVKQVFKEFKNIRVPSSYRNIDKIIHVGMGGSALGCDIIKAVYQTELKQPLQIIRDYVVPAGLDSKTLYVVCSYSGDTEEPLATLTKAKTAGAKIFAIASGGRLGRMIKRGEIPGYVFDPVANPSGQPRIGVGYTLAAELALFKKLGLIQLKDSVVSGSLKRLGKLDKTLGFGSSTAKNQAKKVATQIKGKSLVIVASEHLAGNAHVFANQTNETGKTLSAYHLLPEFNHHLLEGLSFPSANKSQLLFIFLESNLYHPKNQLRYQVSRDVVAKNKVKSVSYRLTSADRLTQALEVLSFSSYVTFYLAIINNVNPNLIPWVDYFKARLKKS